MTRRGKAALGAVTAAAIAGLWYATPDPSPYRMVAVTDAEGRYSLTVPVPGGDCIEGVLTFECADNDSTSKAVSSLDAAYILDAAVESREVDLAACDVTGDGTCSAADAAAVLAYKVGKAGSYSTGEWAPAEVPVTVCPNDNLSVDVEVRVRGDVTGNWRPE